MILRKYPEASLKLKYDLIMRVALVISLLLMVGVMVLFPKFEGSQEKVDDYVPVVQEVIDIPQTQQQIEQARPPSRPSIPIESENEDLSEDITIDATTDFDDYEVWDAPPPPPEDENTGPRVKFIPYDDPPVPIGGFAAIQRNVVYPEIAQEAGITGTVVVQAFIDKYGKVGECTILKGVPNTGLDDAAIAAIKKTRFKPAKQRDRDVGVYISIPVIFRLRD